MKMKLSLLAFFHVPLTLSLQANEVEMCQEFSQREFQPFIQSVVETLPIELYKQRYELGTPRGAQSLNMLVLRDKVREETEKNLKDRQLTTRESSIVHSFAWALCIGVLNYYTDAGITLDMTFGQVLAKALRKPIETLLKNQIDPRWAELIIQCYDQLTNLHAGSKNTLLASKEAQNGAVFPQ